MTYSRVKPGTFCFRGQPSTYSCAGRLLTNTTTTQAYFHIQRWRTKKLYWIANHGLWIMRWNSPIYIIISKDYFITLLQLCGLMCIWAYPTFFLSQKQIGIYHIQHNNVQLPKMYIWDPQYSRSIHNLRM